MDPNVESPKQGLTAKYALLPQSASRKAEASVGRLGHPIERKIVVVLGLRFGVYHDAENNILFCP